jgi:hypothetical protein
MVSTTAFTALVTRSPIPSFAGFCGRFVRGFDAVAFLRVFDAALERAFGFDRVAFTARFLLPALAALAALPAERFAPERFAADLRALAM